MKLSPCEAHIIEVLKDGQPHSAIEFKRGLHGKHIDAVSQRVSSLRRRGFVIDGGGRGGHKVAAYTLVSEPVAV